MYGPQTTTFLKYQRGIIESMVNSKYEPPFYAWQCVSLILQERTVDFVITDEKQMNDFILAMNGVLQYSRLVDTQKSLNGAQRS